MKTPLVTATLSLVLALSGTSLAQVTTAPVGFNTVTCLPNSDTFCSVPFAQSWEFQGLISDTPSVVGDAATITPQGTVSWTENQYATFYFVRMLTGAKAGMYYQITANATGTITVDTAGSDVAGITAGDSFGVSKFWTLAALFPPATQTTFVASATTSPGNRRSTLLLPDQFSPGINLAPSRIFFITGGNWVSTSGFTNANNTLLAPDSYFIVRHGHASIVASTTFTASGLVELNPVTTPLATRAAGQQDNPVTMGRPVPIKLKDLDLISSGAFVASATTAPGTRRDQLLVYDNTVATINRAPSAIYFYTGGNWVSTAGFIVSNDIEINPSSAILIRKASVAGGSSAFWTHAY